MGFKRLEIVVVVILAGKFLRKTVNLIDLVPPTYLSCFQEPDFRLIFLIYFEETFIMLSLKSIFF